MLWILFYELAIISVVYSIVVTVFITFETFYYFFAPKIRFWFRFCDRMLKYYTDSRFESEPHTTFPPHLSCSLLEDDSEENIDDYRDDPEVIGRFRGNRAMVANFINGCKETIFHHSPDLLKKVGDLVPVGKSRAAFVFGGYFTCERSDRPPVFVSLSIENVYSPGGDQDPYPFNTSLLVGNVLKDAFTKDSLRGKCDGLILATHDAWRWWAHHPSFFPPSDFGDIPDCVPGAVPSSSQMQSSQFSQSSKTDTTRAGMTLRSGRVY